MATLAHVSRLIDSKTRDWVMEKGQRKLDSTPSSQVLFFMALKHKSSAAFPNMGSRFHLIDKVTEDIDVVLQQEVDRCLEPLTSTGVVKDVVTTVTVYSNPAADDYILMDVAFKDAAGQPDKVAFAVQFA